MTSERTWDELTDAERIELLTSTLDKTNKKLDGLMRKPLLDNLAPRMDMDWQELAAKEIPELRSIKEVLDSAVMPSFRAGTKIDNTQKTSQRALLDSTFERKQARRLAAASKNKEV